MDELADHSSDAMVTVAALVSRVEALVTTSMLEAAGIQVCIGGAAHAGVGVNSLALGGHRLWIPAAQHATASAILLEVLGEHEWSFSPGLRRAVVRAMVLWGAVSALFGLCGVLAGMLSPLEFILAPLAAFTVPVNPQGRGDYFLLDENGRAYRA